MIQTTAFLISKKEVSHEIYHLFFYVPGEGLSFSPGQYAILTIPSSPNPVKRLYSFAGSNSNKNVFELLVKIVPEGIASEYICSLSVGDTIAVSGPAGLFIEQTTPFKKIYMATGTGFAPIRSFLTSHLLNPPAISLYWGLRDLSEMSLFDELLSLKNVNRSFSFWYCLSQQASFDTIPADLLQYFRKGHIDVVWGSQEVVINPSDEYYLCGSRTVIESLRLLLLAKGVPKDKLFFEKY